MMLLMVTFDLVLLYLMLQLFVSFVEYLSSF